MFCCFNIAIGSIHPFLPTYARQLGFTSVAVGMMGTVQAIVALFFRPAAGYIADRFVSRKTFVLALLVMVAGAFIGIHLIRTDNDVVALERRRSVNQSSEQLKYCQTLEPFNECLLSQLLVQRAGGVEMQCTVLFECAAHKMRFSVGRYVICY